MDVIIEQYFDFSLMIDEFDRGPRGLLADDPAVGLRRRPVAALGPGARGAAPAPRQSAGAGSGADDRLHRRLPGHPPAAGPPARLGQLRRARARGRDPAGDRHTHVPRQAGPLLVRRDGADDHLRRLHGRGVPGGDRGDPGGQMEAARSLGMTHGQAMRYVIVPQAVRTVIPPLLNDFIALMKDTSLVSVLGFVEVVQAGRDVQSEFFNSSALTLGSAHVPRGHDPAGAARRPADRRPAGALPAGGGGRATGASPNGWPGARWRWRAAPLGLEDTRAPSRCSSLQGVHKRFGELHVLRGIDLDVDRGQVGLRDRPQRARASARCCAASTCSSRPTRAGSCSRARRSPARVARGVNFVRRRVGMVFQQFNLFPHKTGARQRGPGAAEGARRSGRGAREGQGCWSGWASRTSGRVPDRLSGGQQQRVAIRGRWRWTRT